MFAPEHPCLVGHFPGHPLVPGALLLDESVALLLAERPGAQLEQVVTCKFLAPVGPGDTVDVSAQETATGTVTLACAVGGITVMRAAIRLCGA